MQNKVGLKIAGVAGLAAVIAGGWIAAYTFSDIVKNQVKLAFSKPDSYFSWVCEKNTDDTAEFAAEQAQRMSARNETGQTANVELRFEPAEDGRGKLKEIISDMRLSVLDPKIENIAKRIIDGTDYLSIEAVSSVSKNASGTNAVLTRNGEEIFAAETVTAHADELYYVRFPGLTDRWLYMETEDTLPENFRGKAFIRQMPVVPEPEDAAARVRKYSELILEDFSKASVKRRAPVTVAGLEVKYTEVTAHLTAEQFYDTISRVCETASTDGVLMDLSGTPEQFSKTMEVMAEQFRSAVSSGRLPDGTVQLKLYVDFAGNIRGIDLSSGAEESLFCCVGLSGGNLAGEFRCSDKDRQLADVQLLMTKNGGSYSGTVTGTYGSSEDIYSADFSNLKLKDGNAHVFADGSLQLQKNGVSVSEMTLSSDGNSQSVSGSVKFEGKKIGDITATYSASDGAAVEVPDYMDATHFVPSRPETLRDYADHDSILRFAKQLLKGIGLTEDEADRFADGVGALLTVSDD